MESNQPILQLKRYPNRRFYSPEDRRHLTLEEIRDRIRDGRTVRITQSQDDQDVTARILTQILLELEGPKIDVFPPEMLHLLIRSTSGPVRDFMDQYFSQALQAFLRSGAEFERQWRRMMGLQAGEAPRDPATWMTELWSGMWRGGGSGGPEDEANSR